MKAVTEDSFYLLGRDSVETKRLDDQHNFLVKVCGDSLISKSIPEEKIFSIADVATGTGIWLRDVKSHLESAYPTDSSKPRNNNNNNYYYYYHGFDISDAQFPAGASHGCCSDGINYSLHDCLKPFPVEHHNRYDLVHVRLLVSAIKEADFKLIVANLTPLLKPGGYLQWEDLDLYSFLTTPDPKYHSFPALQTLRMAIETQVSFGASPHVPDAVAAGARAAGLTDVLQIEYNTKDHPELADRTQKWVMKVLTPLLKSILSRTGRVAEDEQEEMEKEIRRHLEGVQKSYEQGLVTNGAMGMVVARKPEA